MKLKSKISIDDLHDLVSSITTTTTTTTSTSTTSTSTTSTTESTSSVGFVFNSVGAIVNECSWSNCWGNVVIVIVVISVAFFLFWVFWFYRKKPMHDKSTNVNWVRQICFLYI